MELYHGSNDTLYADWHGYSTVQSVKDGSMAILRAMEEYRCYRLISDDRRALGTWMPAIEWLENEFMPLLIEKGMKKIAHIYSENEEAIESMNRFLMIDLPYEVQVFHDFETACLWLTGMSTAAPISSTTCRFDTPEGERIIDCSDVYYIMKVDKKAIVQIKERQFEISETLAKLEQQLPTDKLMRVHRSIIINIDKIKELKYQAGGSYRAYLKDLGNVYVTVSRKHVSRLKESLNII